MNQNKFIRASGLICLILLPSFTIKTIDITIKQTIDSIHDSHSNHVHHSHVDVLENNRLYNRRKIIRRVGFLFVQKEKRDSDIRRISSNRRNEFLTRWSFPNER